MGLRFFADHNVSESTCKALEDAGHEVIRLRDVMPPDSPDPIVATAAESAEAILVSHDRDFAKIAPRIPKGERSRFKRLSRIHLQCRYPSAAQRMIAALSLIQFEWEEAQGRKDKRIQVIVQQQGIKALR